MAALADGDAAVASVRVSFAAGAGPAARDGGATAARAGVAALAGVAATAALLRALRACLGVGVVLREVGRGVGRW